MTSLLVAYHFNNLNVLMESFQNLKELPSVNHLSNGTKLSRMHQVNFFKRCLPQILLGPLLNTLCQIMMHCISKKNCNAKTNNNFKIII